MTSLLIRLFVKDYKNVSNFRVRENYGKVASIVGIVTNFILFLIKITAGTLFNSIAITADAINNLSDSGSSVVTLLGFKISGKPADAKHPYGHARMEYISGLIVSFIILYLGVQLIQSSIDKIIHPRSTGFNAISISVLVIAILIKLWQCLFYRHIGKKIGSTTIIAISFDSRNDVIATSSILAAAVLTYFTGFNLDGYMGALVALFIMISGLRLIFDTISPLLGVAPTKELVDSIYEKILGYEGILGLHDLAVHNYGPAKCFASVHCEVAAEQDILISHDIIDNIERDFLRDEGIHLVIHLDPIITENTRINDLKERVEEIIARLSPEIGMHDFRVVKGVTHTKLIFDIVVPFEFKWSDDETVRLISNEISKINDTYRSVIIVDHNYVPDNDDLH